jgi:hypothetical protein
MFRNWSHKILFCGAAFALALLAGCSSGKIDPGRLAQDRLDCQNLMSLHAWYHSAFMNDVELQKLWAQKAPDVVFAQNTGFWQGMDKIKAYYGAPVQDKTLTAGHFQMHTITTAVIQVAEDRKTAKGIFYTPGMVGTYNGGTWMWERYGADFINEDGVWKIWHLHVYSDFSTGFGKELTGEMAAPPSSAAPTKTSGKAEKFGAESVSNNDAAAHPGQRQVAPGVWLTQEAMTPSYTAKEGYKELAKDTVPLLLPTPPVPYKTFSETFSYADPDEYTKALAALKK